MSNFMNRKLTINNWLLTIGGLLIPVVILGAYYLGAQAKNSSPGQGDVISNESTSTQAIIIFPTGTPDPATATADSEELPSQTPDVAPSGTDTITETPAISITSSATVSPTASLTAGAITRPEDWAKLVSSLPSDGSYFAPTENFTKVWILKNIGTTTWTKDYDLVFISGTSMTKKLVYPLPSKVLPGKSIQISLEQIAPKTPGTYQGFWMLSNKSGDTFGIGDEADQPFKNKITVLNVDPSNRYDLLLKYCQATWWNSKGEIIKCPGEPRQITGFVLLSTQPILENGPSDKPVLWVHTNNNLEGSISGKYPAFLVKDGDHFKAKVGCISGYPKCNVTFKLQYRIGSGSNQTLGTWKEQYGGGITTINVDLSPLAGQNVQFILRMASTNNYPESAQGFWMNPRITYIQPTQVPTATFTPTFTATPTDTEVPPSETPTETPTP
jgi:hypothetical protein